MKRMAWPVDQRVTNGADRLTLADAGQAEGQDIEASSSRSPSAMWWRPSDQRRRQAAFLERRERLPRRQFRGATQSGDAALVPLLRFELDDLQEQRQGGLLRRPMEAATPPRARRR